MKRFENMTWKEQKLDYLDNWYRPKAEEWKEMHDDRRLFSNMYYQMREAIESLGDNPHLYVKVAMNDKISSDIEIMDRIKEHFKDR